MKYILKLHIEKGLLYGYNNHTLAVVIDANWAYKNTISYHISLYYWNAVICILKYIKVEHGKCLLCGYNNHTLAVVIDANWAGSPKEILCFYWEQLDQLEKQEADCSIV